jgi:hypothetical protein
MGSGDQLVAPTIPLIVARKSGGITLFKFLKLDSGLKLDFDEVLT